MALLPTQAKLRIVQQIQDDGEAPGNVTLVQLAAAVDAADAYWESAETVTPLTSMLVGLPLAYRTSATAVEMRKLYARVGVSRANFTMRSQRGR